MTDSAAAARDGFEFRALSEAFEYGWPDIEWLTFKAMKSALAPFDERLRIIDTVIKPGFAAFGPRMSAHVGRPADVHRR